MHVTGQTGRVSSLHTIFPALSTAASFLAFQEGIASFQTIAAEWLPAAIRGRRDDMGVCIAIGSCPYR